MALFKKDQKEINLVPEAEKKARGTRVVLLVGSVVGSSLLLIFIVSLAFFLLNLNESHKAGSLEKDLSRELSTWQSLAPIAQQSTGLKGKATQIKDLKSSNNNFRLSLEEVRKYVPDGVRLESLTVKGSGNLALQASAPAAAEIYQFVNTLDQKSEFFESVEIATFVKNDESFILNLDLKPKAK